MARGIYSLEPRPDPRELDPLIEAGLPLIPLTHRKDKVRHPGKQPRDEGWNDPEVKYDAADMRAWLADDKGSVGNPLSNEDLVVDFDPRNDPKGRPADELLRIVEEKLGIDLSAAPRVRSGGGGLHVRLRKPAGLKKRELFRAELGFDFGKAVEIKSAGRQVVAPGSVHPETGFVYRWENLAGPLVIPPAPQELLDAIPDAGETRVATYERGGFDGTLSPRAAELVERNEKVRARYHGDATGLPDPSPSGVDMSLATLAALHGLEGAEIEALIRCSRDARQVEQKRDGYYTLTVGKALADAAERRPKVAAVDFAPYIEAAKTLSHLEQSTPSARAARFAKRMVPGPEWARETPPAPFIDGLLTVGGVVNVFGPTGQFKTFTMVDLGLAVAARLKEWLGETLYLHGRVAYLASEGEYALVNRLRAWEQVNGRPIPEDFRVLRGGIRLGTKADQEDALAWLEEFKPVLVILDTLSAATAGADENASSDMGPTIDWCREVSRRTGGTVIFVHHPTKADANSSRGSGVLEANVDGVITINKGVIKAKKIRADRKGRPIGFALEDVDLGPDPNPERPGRRIRGAVVVRRRDVDPSLEIPVIVEFLMNGSAEVKVKDVVKEYISRRGESEGTEGISEDAVEKKVKKAIPIGREHADPSTGLYREQDKTAAGRPWLIYRLETDAGAGES